MTKTSSQIKKSTRYTPPHKSNPQQLTLLTFLLFKSPSKQAAKGNKQKNIITKSYKKQLSNPKQKHSPFPLSIYALYSALSIDQKTLLSHKSCRICLRVFTSFPPLHNAEISEKPLIHRAVPYPFIQPSYK